MAITLSPQTQSLINSILGTSSKIQASTGTNPLAALASASGSGGSNAPLTFGKVSPAINAGGSSSGGGWSWNPIHDVAKISTDVEKTGKYLLPRITDLLSRGQYASADAAQTIIDRAESHGRTPPNFSDIWAGIKAIPGGIEGKNKNNWENV